MNSNPRVYDNGKFQKTVKCFQCQQQGHTDAQCPTREKRKQLWAAHERQEQSFHDDTKVYIYNLDSRMSKAHVKKLTSKFGTARNIEIADGKCTADFANKTEAEAVVKGLDGKVCLAKKLEVATKPKKASAQETLAQFEEKLTRLSRGEEETPDATTEPVKKICRPDIKLKVFVKCKCKGTRVYGASTKEQPFQLYVEVRGNPRHGEANDEVITLIAKTLSCKEADVEITRGFTSEEDKHITVKNRGGMNEEQVVKQLQRAITK